jgi:hypothetical protein
LHAAAVTRKADGQYEPIVPTKLKEEGLSGIQGIKQFRQRGSRLQSRTVHRVVNLLEVLKGHRSTIVAFTAELPKGGVLQIPAQSPKIYQRAWYGMASYHVTEKFTAGAYYSTFLGDLTKKDVATSFSKDTVLSSRFDVNQYFYFKLEGHYMHGNGQGFYQASNPKGLQKNQVARGARRLHVLSVLIQAPCSLASSSAQRA